MRGDLKILTFDILRTNEAARNSDVHLLFGFWASEGLPEGDVKHVLDELSAPSGILRQRAIIQNEFGLYLPTDPTVRRRRGHSLKSYDKGEER
jgi:hypothetical protein